MKKLILLLLLISELFSFDSETASKIFDKIFYAMLKSEEITVYTANKDYEKVIRNASNLYFCTLAKRADIILVSDFDELPPEINNKIVFSTSYPVFKENENVVGAFYWDRGHIKIEFSKKRLLKKGITLPANFDKYIKDEF